MFWLSDEAWAAIKPHLPKNQPVARRVNDRRMISGIVLKAGGRWCVCPAYYGPSTTICNRFNRWPRQGFLVEAARRVSRCGRGDEEHSDRRHVHQDPARCIWRKGGARRKRLGVPTAVGPRKSMPSPTSSVAPIAAWTSPASPPDTINSPRTSFQTSRSQLPWPSGYDQAI